MTPRNLLLWMLIVTLSLTSCTIPQPPATQSLSTSGVLSRLAVAAPPAAGVALTPAVQLNLDTQFQPPRPFWLFDLFQPFDPFRPFGPYRPIKAPVPWVRDEITFFGATQDIQELLSALPENVPALNPEIVDRFDLTPLLGDLVQNDESIRLFSEFFGGPPSEEQLAQGIVAELYRFPENIDILQFIAIVDRARNNLRVREDRRLFAFAEPNFWLTSVQATQTCYTVSGQPNSFGNGPFGTGVKSNGSIDDFNKQWPFQLLAGNPSTSTISAPITNVVSTGVTNTVDVVIFDNSPFTDVLESATGTGVAEERTVELTLTQVMTLNVLHWNLGVSPTKLITNSNEHGVFIASLIHKIAPSSKISLVRVLDESGCGVAFALNNAIAGFSQNYVTNNNTVFNLSLGIPKSMIEKNPKMYLELVLTNYLDVKDILLVAAAGNNKASELLLPAGYVDDTAYSPYVKVAAVEASNIDGNRACFSNRGKDQPPNGLSDHAILAPGGDGIGQECSSSLMACEGNPTCVNGIMGRTHDKQWIFWSGTSFAAPLVSGAAARWLSQGCSALEVIQHLTNSPRLDLTSPPCP